MSSLIEEKLLSSNSGFIDIPPEGTDYIAGVNSPIVYEELVPDGNWGKWLPKEEQQNSIYFDSMACVSFSANNVVETQVNFLIDNRLISIDDMEWLSSNGYIEAGKPNLSDRYLARMSGTTRQGNSMKVVCDTLSHWGAVPESKWSYPTRQQTPVFDWDDYYAEIPQELKDLGKEFKQRFPIGYEFVYGDLANHLKHTPIQIATAVCSGWSTDSPIKACDKPIGHAIELYGYFLSKPLIFDTYEPFKKVLASDYQIPYRMKIIVNVKRTMTNAKLVKNGSEYGYYLPCASEGALISEGKHYGIIIPEKEEGKVDWDNVKPDITMGA